MAVVLQTAVHSQLLEERKGDHHIADGSAFASARGEVGNHHISDGNTFASARGRSPEKLPATLATPLESTGQPVAATQRMASTYQQLSKESVC